MRKELNWRRSSHCTGQTSCVETGHTDRAVYVRDSKTLAAGTVRLSCRAWTAFLDLLKEEAR